MNIETPFKAFSTNVQPDWIDDNGHMNVAYYHLVFDLAVWPFFDWLGFNDENRQRYSISTFALETHLTYLSEVKVHTEVRIESRLLDVNEKRIHFYQEMIKSDSDQLAATHESLGTVVDMQKRKSTRMPDTIYKRMQAVKSAHSRLDKPWQIGHVMSITAKPPTKIRTNSQS